MFSDRWFESGVVSRRFLAHRAQGSVATWRWIADVLETEPTAGRRQRGRRPLPKA